MAQPVTSTTVSTIIASRVKPFITGTSHTNMTRAVGGGMHA